MVDSKSTSMPGRGSADAQRRHLFGLVRQVSRLCGRGMAITIDEAGVWYLDDIPAPRYLGDCKRFYTSDFVPFEGQSTDSSLRSM